MKIKVDDNVRVIAGKDKGKTGKVTQVFASQRKVVIDGINKSVKHIKAQGGNQGQRVEYNGPIHISNVRVLGKTGEGRIGYKFLDVDGKRKKVRVLKTKKGAEDLE
jgi:large subunit ribosomal protein L24